MTSYLFISTDQELALAEAEKICTKNKISLHDVTLFDTTNIDSKQKKSIGIEDIRQLQKTIYLKPLKGFIKAIIVKDAQLLTHEAQNALLKVLEEPPPSTFLFLISDSLDSLLPTVQSRCSIFKFSENKNDLSENNETIINEINELKNADMSFRLKKAEELSKNKDEALIWLNLALKVIHVNFLKNPQKKDAFIMNRITFIIKVVKTSNTNLRLSLEELFLSI